MVFPTVRSAPVLPALNPHKPLGETAKGPGLYEVASGAVMMRGMPDLQTGGLAALRGGTRFYATPYRLGGVNWLKLCMEGVSPPTFSPSALGRTMEEMGGHTLDTKGTMVFRPKNGKAYSNTALSNGIKNYRASVPKTMYHTPGAHLHGPNSTGEIWLQNEDQVMIRIRDKKDFGDLPKPDKTNMPQRTKRRPESQAPASAQFGASSSMPSMPLSPQEDPEIAHLQDQLEAKHREIEQLHSMPDGAPEAPDGTQPIPSPPKNQDLKMLATCGGGCWMNHNRYGPLKTPINGNCGRWRQHGVGVFT